MECLANIRFAGFTVFGFWIPLAVWLPVLLYIAARSTERRLLLSVSFLCIALSLLSAVEVVRSDGGYGVKMIGEGLFFGLFLILEQLLGRRFAYHEIGAIVWMASIFTDLFSVVFIQNPLLLRAGYSMMLADALHFRWEGLPMHGWHSIGGAGILDGLLVIPVLVMLQMLMSRAFCSLRRRTARISSVES